MKNSAQAYYQNNINTYERIVSETKRKLKLLSVFRLVSFIISITGFFVFMNKNLTIAIVTGLIFLILFFVFIKRYLSLQKKANLHSNLLLINQNELKALGNDYEVFGSGEEFIDHTHDYSYDIDLFGVGSLFQFLDRSFSLGGKKCLSHWLKNGKNSETILQTQVAVNELADLPDYRQLFTATGMLNAENKVNLEHLYSWLNDSLAFRFPGLLKILSIALPSVALISVMCLILGIIPGSFFITVFLLNLLIVGSILKTTNKVHALLQKQFITLENYASLLVLIEQKTFSSDLLKDLQKQINNENYLASGQIKKLSKIISFFDYRLNMFIAAIINGLLLWDIQCLFRLEKWKKTCASLVPSWIDSISELDALNSLANLKFNNPRYCFPSIENKTVINASNLIHPQILKEEAVDNNIRITEQGNFIIVTGPNMAGKSTFLRTVAVNLVLAKTGSVVGASKFSFSNIPIITSMRTTDSLLKHESYFYAELKRLKHIITVLQSGKPVIIILDEILKGTNSKDKQLGSIAFMKQIIKLGGTGIIATHDLALGDLEKKYPQNIQNKCFEIEIEGSEIFYDYKLRDGITKKMNATFLMEQMGITVSKLVN